MDYPLIVTSEKFTVCRFIKKHGKININDPETVAKEAWEIYGTSLTKQEVQYIFSHFEKLEQEFKEGRNGQEEKV